MPTVDQSSPFTQPRTPSPNAIPDISAADIANAILFLASDEAKVINGVCLPVDRAWGVI